jgi:hypothetical protein
MAAKDHVRTSELRIVAAWHGMAGHEHSHMFNVTDALAVTIHVACKATGHVLRPGRGRSLYLYDCPHAVVLVLLRRVAHRVAHRLARHLNGWVSSPPMDSSDWAGHSGTPCLHQSYFHQSHLRQSYLHQSFLHQSHLRQSHLHQSHLQQQNIARYACRFDKRRR